MASSGAETVLVAPEKGTVQASNNHVEKGDTFDADLAVADAQASESVTCPEGGFTLVASRNPDDLPAFTTGAIAACS